MKRFWQVANIVALAFALIANFLVGAQALGTPAIGDISDTYATYLTPAGYAFSIWSVIYVWLLVVVWYQARDIFWPKENNTLPQTIGPWLVVASIANGAWTYVFVQEAVGFSVIILLALTASLYVLLWRLGVAVVTPTLRTLLCLWWPLSIYAGWVTVASVVNVASWLDSLSLAPSAVMAGASLVLLAGVLIVLLVRRNVRELVLACVWGVVAIGVRQWSLEEGAPVALVAFGVATALVVAVAAHGYIHRNNLMKLSS